VGAPRRSIHYYDAISTPSGLNWNFAWDSALGHGGYLATITSQAENNFIFHLVDSSRYWYTRPGTGKLAGPWLGAPRTSVRTNRTAAGTGSRPSR